MKTEEKIQRFSDFEKLKDSNWLPAYTWVLTANLVYILLFLILMKLMG